jgi:ABC-type branched-subunit amino acid transport system substrate-binding protein/predicted negative regulator of RcsB-dependent stress response
MPLISAKKIFLLLLCLWIFMPSSVLPAPARGSAGPPEERRAYFSAKQYYDEGAYERAVSALQQFLTTYPKSPLLPEAHFLMGQSYIRLQKYNEAMDPLRTVVEGFSTAPFAGEARLQLGKVYLQLGMVEEAIPVLEQEAVQNRDAQTRQGLYAQIADLYLNRKEPMKAVDALLKQRQLIKDREARLPVEGKIRQVIEQNLEDRQLYRLFEQYPQSYPGDEALLKLSEASLGTGDLFRAERYLNQFLGHFPKHPSVQRAKELLSSIVDRINSYRFRIGVLLPLTGKEAPYADSVLKGIQLAMEDVQTMFPEKSVGLVIRDFEEQPAKLKDSAEELIREYGSVAIVGPLLSKHVAMVAPMAERNRVPLITPTATARKPVEDNAYVFRNTVTHEFVGKTLAEYAMLKSGLRRFVIFYPQDGYGLEMMKILSEEVNRLGGEIIASEAYPPDANDFGDPIRHVVQLDLARYGAMIPPDNPGTGQKPEYIPGYDGIFLLGDGMKTGLLASQLAFYDIEDRTLLVSHGGNSSEFLLAGNRFVEGAILVDSFFQGSTDPAVRTFVSRYQARYQELPDLFAAQAYDCIQMILLALKSGAIEPDQVRDYLAQVRGFHGVSGLTTFHPKGHVEKRLFVIQVKNGKYVQVN